MSCRGSRSRGTGTSEAQMPVPSVPGVSLADCLYLQSRIILGRNPDCIHHSPTGVTEPAPWALRPAAWRPGRRRRTRTHGTGTSGASPPCCMSCRGARSRGTGTSEAQMPVPGVPGVRLADCLHLQSRIILGTQPRLYSPFASRRDGACSLGSQASRMATRMTAANTDTWDRHLRSQSPLLHELPRRTQQGDWHKRSADACPRCAWSAPR